MMNEGIGFDRMNKPLISVIIPVYNAEKYLDRCIQSVLQQDQERFELIIVDDGSTDCSGSIADKWAGKDGRIRVFHRENGGQSGARNLGLDQAEGEYISFVDSDDYVAPEYLSCLLSLFSLSDRCGITAVNHYIVRKDCVPANPEGEGTAVLSAAEAMESVLFHGCMDVSPWGKLYRKEVFDGVRFPENRIFEDTWLFGELVGKTENIVYGKRCCYYYVIHEESTVRRTFSPRNLQYIEAAEKLAADALVYGEEMRVGGIRRVNHARLSVLRYMEHCDGQYLPLKKELRKEVLYSAPDYIRDPRTPRRDRTAVLLLRLGFVPFYAAWRLYSAVRR